MPAYIIVAVQINNPEEYEEYKKLTPASIAFHRGSFIVRGGNAEVLEGDWKPGRVVVLEFPDADRTKQWWSSIEYASAKIIRQGAAITGMIIADGVNAF